MRCVRVSEAGLRLLRHRPERLRGQRLLLAGVEFRCTMVLLWCIKRLFPSACSQEDWPRFSVQEGYLQRSRSAPFESTNTGVPEDCRSLLEHEPRLKPSSLVDRETIGLAVS